MAFGRVLVCSCRVILSEWRLAMSSVTVIGSLLAMRRFLDMSSLTAIRSLLVKISLLAISALTILALSTLLFDLVLLRKATLAVLFLASTESQTRTGLKDTHNYT